MRRNKGLAALLAAICPVILSGCVYHNPTKVEIAFIGTQETAAGKELLAFEGARAFAASAGTAAGYYGARSLTLDGVAAAVRYAANDRAKIFLSADERFGELLYEVQFSYNDYYFVLSETTPKLLDGSEGTFLRNTTCIFYDEVQLGFLAGYAAVGEGYTELVFCADGEEQDYLTGFLYGADRAAGELGAAVTVAEATSAEIAACYESGAQVVFACGDAFAAASEAAKACGGKVIGTEYDRSAEGEQVLASAVKYCDRAMNAVLTLWKSGYWTDEAGDKSLRGRVETLGLDYRYIDMPNTDYIGLTTEGFENYKEEQHLEAKAKLASGEWRAEGELNHIRRI